MREGDDYGSDIIPPLVSIATIPYISSLVYDSIDGLQGVLLRMHDRQNLFIRHVVPHPVSRKDDILVSWGDVNLTDLWF